MPREINESYTLNLTLKSNVQVEYRSIFLDHFGIQQQKTANDSLSHTIELRYIDKTSRSIAQLHVEIFPVAGKDFFLEIDGYFKIAEIREPFPSSQFDFLLFFIVTSIVPPLFLLKLFYKRLRNIG